MHWLRPIDPVVGETSDERRVLAEELARRLSTPDHPHARSRNVATSVNEQDRTARREPCWRSLRSRTVVLTSLEYRCHCDARPLHETNLLGVSDQVT